MVGQEPPVRGWTAGPDVRILLFTAALAVVSICAFGLLPAFAATRGTLMPRLRETPSAGGRAGLQGAFVVAQLSLLLAGGLSLRALQKSSAIDLGFDPNGVLTASYNLVLQNYSPELRTAFRRQLLSRTSVLPGVTHVGVANMAPLAGTMVGTVVASATAGCAERQALRGRPLLLELRVTRYDCFAVRPQCCVHACVAVSTVSQTGHGKTRWRAVRIGGVPVTVIGVMQCGFRLRPFAEDTPGKAVREHPTDRRTGGALSCCPILPEGGPTGRHQSPAGPVAPGETSHPRASSPRPWRAGNTGAGRSPR